ncbi:hypothetical protein D3C73_1337060 [compost metagenome]
MGAGKPAALRLADQRGRIGGIYRRVDKGIGISGALYNIADAGQLFALAVQLFTGFISR